MSKTFCEPSRKGVQQAFISLMDLQQKQRDLIEKQLHIAWKVSPEAIHSIRAFALQAD